MNSIPKIIREEAVDYKPVVVNLKETLRTGRIRETGL